MPAVGQMKKRVTLLAPARSDDGAGGFARAAAELGTFFANVRPASWSEQRNLQRNEQRVSHVVTMRRVIADPSLLPAPGGRVRWTDHAGRERNAYIHTVVDPDEDGRFIELGVEEGGPL